MSAQQPVSFCCISCLVTCKCGSKHIGIEQKVIVFDKCYEAGQLFATGGQPVFFFLCNALKRKKLRGLPLQRTFSRKWSVRQLLTNLWSVCVSLVCIWSFCSYWIIQILKNTGVFWENSPLILSIWCLILHNDVSRGCVVRKWCQSILKEGKWGFLNSARVDGVGLKTVFFRMWTCRPQWAGYCVFTWCTAPVVFRTITCMEPIPVV